MQYDIAEPYPFAADVVLKAFSDPAFHRAKMALPAQGNGSAILGESVRDGSFAIRVERRIPLRIPGLKLAELVLLTEESWNPGARSGTIAVDISSVPLKISGRAQVRDQGRGCVVHCQWTIAAAIPLIGRTLEKAVAAELARSSQREAAQTLDLVRRYAG